MTKDDIQAEFDAFFEFDTDDRSVVTSVSCRLFAQRIAALTEARVRKKIADELGLLERAYANQRP